MRMKMLMVMKMEMVVMIKMMMMPMVMMMTDMQRGAGGLGRAEWCYNLQHPNISDQILNHKT